MTGTTPARGVPPRRRGAARRSGRSALLALAVGLAATGLTVAVATTSPERAPAPGPGIVPLDHLSQVCLPDLTPRQGGRTTEVVTVAAALAGLDDGGEAAAGEVGGTSSAQVPTRRGALIPLASPQTRSALLLRATGPAAAARSTFRTDAEPQSGVLAVQECVAPRTRWWFTGAGAALDHRSLLVLANVEDGPAVVEVTFLGPDGIVDSVGTRGVTLAPGEVSTVDLVDVAPQSDELAVRVATSRGRVAAAVTDSFAAEPGAAPGREWIPPQDEPARRLRLGPLPAEAGTRTLVVANPSSREALVEVGVAGGGGTFAPTEGAQVRVPPGTVVSSDVTAAVGEDPSAVSLRSPVPVVATLRSVGTDTAYAAPLGPLTGPAVGPALGGGALHLTGGPDGAEVQVAALDAAGAEVSGTTLDLGAGATVAWSVPRRAAYVVVSPTRGRVTGGVVSAGRDEGLTQVALRPAAVSLRRPAVVPAVPTRVGAHVR